MKGLRSLILALLLVATLVVPPVVYVLRKGELEKQMSIALMRHDGPTIRKLIRSWPAPVNARTSWMTKYTHSREISDTPLIWASAYGDLETARICIRKGADVNAVDIDGRTALHRAESRAVVEMLLAAGADLNAMDGGNRTPLFDATASGKEEALQCLIEKGSDVNAKDIRGRTPLTEARENEKLKAKPELQKRIVDILIQHGATE